MVRKGGRVAAVTFFSHTYSDIPPDLPVHDQDHYVDRYGEDEEDDSAWAGERYLRGFGVFVLVQLYTC